MLTSSSLIPPRFLYRFAAPVLRYDKPWKPLGITLEEKHELINLSVLDGANPFASVRAAWSPEGLFFWVHVEGKSKSPWCRDTRLEDSDGLQLWIDTRDTHNIHRASKYCHRFIFLPGGGGRAFDRPTADQLLINRARENAPPIRPDDLQVANKIHATGYTLSAFVPKTALQGFDPSEYRRIGFQYAIADRELGLQGFSIGAGFPYEEDPSVWSTLELVD